MKESKDFQLPDNRVWSGVSFSANLPISTPKRALDASLQITYGYRLAVRQDWDEPGLGSQDLGKELE
jgi:hypothetical protein